jgi:hypothetical protein
MSAVPPTEPPECCAARLFHSFDTPAASWQVDHNLGRIPASVQVSSPQHEVLSARVVHPTANRTVVTHSSPTTGYVILLI